MFDDLLLIVADTQGIKDQNETSELDTNQPQQDKFTGLDDKIISEIEQQRQLRKVWSEICKMPVRHRLALLLNLKDRQLAKPVVDKVSQRPCKNRQSHRKAVKSPLMESSFHINVLWYIHFT